MAVGLSLAFGWGLRVEKRLMVSEGIGNCQNVDFFGGGSLIMHKYHRPDIVRPAGFLTIFAKLRLYRRLRGLVPHFQAHLAVEPAHGFAFNP